MALLCLPFIFSSCFEIIEEISLRPDGSGDMTITVNLSQSRTKVASIMMMDSVQGYKVPSKQTIQKEMAKAVADLSKMPGISNVKSSTDFTNYIATISFSFKELSHINNVSRSILQARKIQATNISVYSFNKATGTFKREYKYYPAAKTEYNKLKKEDRDIFRTASYTSIYRFPAAISTSANPSANISKSRKAVMQKSNILDLINGKTNLSNQVQLAK